MLLLSTHTILCACDRRTLSANRPQLSHQSAEARSRPTLPPQPAPLRSSGRNKAQHCFSQLFFSTLRSLALLLWANNLPLLGTHIFVAGNTFQRFALLAKLGGWILSCTLTLLGAVRGDKTADVKLLLLLPRGWHCATVSFGQTTLANPIPPGCFSAWWTRQKIQHRMWSILEVRFLVPVWAWFQHDPSRTTLCDS